MHLQPTTTHSDYTCLSLQIFEFSSHSALVEPSVGFPYCLFFCSPCSHQCSNTLTCSLQDYYSSLLLNFSPFETSELSLSSLFQCLVSSIDQLILQCTLNSFRHFDSSTQLRFTLITLTTKFVYHLLNLSKSSKYSSQPFQCLIKTSE